MTVTAEKRLSLTIIAGSFALFGLFLARQLPSAISGDPDFPNYFFSGKRLISGKPVYGSIVQDVRRELGIDDYVAYPADPPLTVALMSPLGLLPYRTAWLLWMGCSIVLLLASVYSVGRQCSLSPHLATAVACACLVTTSFRALIVRNHMEALLLLAGVLGWHAMKRDKPLLGAGWWGAAAALKLFPGLWLLGISKRIKAAATGWAVAALLSLIGIALVGWGDTLAFVQEVIPASRRWYGAAGNYSLVSFGTALWAPWFGWVLCGAGAAVLLPTYLLPPFDADRIWVQGTAIALLLSPFAWLNYLVLMLPALIIMGTSIDWSIGTRRWGGLVLIAGLAFWRPVMVHSKLVSLLISFVPTYALVGLALVASRWVVPRRVAPRRVAPRCSTSDSRRRSG